MFMKKFLLVIFLALAVTQTSYAGEDSSIFKLWASNNDTREIKTLLNSQVKFANDTNFDKFIATYDKNYVNGDGFNLDTYSALVKEIWNTYDKIEYDIKIKNIDIDHDTAIAELVETSYAEIPVTANMNGVLKSEANSVYYLKKLDGEWKVISDTVLNETTSMLYGDARFLDIKLTAPTQILANTEYTATLEFTPPKDYIAIASIANDKVEYPQKQAKEVFRKFPDDNVLERMFTANSDNVNEYIIASIGLTKAAITDTSIKLSLTGFGYQITRVNVIPQNKFITSAGADENDDKDK